MQFPITVRTEWRSVWHCW